MLWSLEDPGRDRCSSLALQSITGNLPESLSYCYLSMPASLDSGDSGRTEPLLSPSMSTTLTQLGLWDVDQRSTSFRGLDRHS